MFERLHHRIAVLFGLAILAVGLALVGTAIGVGGAAISEETTGEFTISENNVTFSDGNREATPVDNLSGVQQVEISEDRGEFKVITRNGSSSLGAEQRERAKQIVLANETIQQYVAGVETYEIDVEPIEKVDAETVQINTTNVTETEPTTRTNGDDTRTVSFTVVETRGTDSVSVAREPSYVTDEVNVRIFGPSGELQYSIVVDLAEGTIVKYTDWETIRSK